MEDEENKEHRKKGRQRCDIVHFDEIRKGKNNYPIMFDCDENEDFLTRPLNEYQHCVRNEMWNIREQLQRMKDKQKEMIRLNEMTFDIIKEIENEERHSAFAQSTDIEPTNEITELDNNGSDSSFLEIDRILNKKAISVSETKKTMKNNPFKKKSSKKMKELSIKDLTTEMNTGKTSPKQEKKRTILSETDSLLRNGQIVDERLKETRELISDLQELVDDVELKFEEEREIISKLLGRYEKPGIQLSINCHKNVSDA